MIKKILLFLIKLYQFFISPLIGSNCRFYPSCSAYAYQAIDLHGPFRGLIFSLKRLSKCHPFHSGGYDAVPEKTSK
ncbi:MAG: membrane protein insertion efficiency factor YidD [Desulfobacterales bacterium]